MKEIFDTDEAFRSTQCQTTVETKINAASLSSVQLVTYKTHNMLIYIPRAHDLGIY